MSDLHIIFTRGNGVLISKERYGSWQEIQNEYDGYMASLGPWDAVATASWLDEEYDDLSPSGQEQVNALMSSEETVRCVSFARKS